MKRIGMFGALAAGLLALPALAQWDAEEVENETQTEEDLDSIRLLDERKMSVALEGGLGGYTGGLADSTAVGPVWGVRVGQDMEILGGELAYQGSRNPIEDARLVDGGAVWRHGLEGLAKAGVEVGANVRPFVGAGLGVSYVNVSDTADPPYRNDFLAQIPLAAGVDWNRGALHAGVRASYSILLFDEFAEPTPSADNPGGGLLTGSLVVGGEF